MTPEAERERQLQLQLCEQAFNQLQQEQQQQQQQQEQEGETHFGLNPIGTQQLALKAQNKGEQFRAAAEG